MQAIPCIMTGRDAIVLAETVSFYAYYCIVSQARRLACETNYCVSNALRMLSSTKQGSGKTLAYCLPLCYLLPLFPPVQPGLCWQFSAPLTVGRLNICTHAGRTYMYMYIVILGTWHLCESSSLVCA